MRLGSFAKGVVVKELATKNIHYEYISVLCINRYNDMNTTS